MLLHESFTAAIADAHRRDLLRSAERYRTLRHVRAAAAALATRSRQQDVPADRNEHAERRYAMSR